MSLAITQYSHCVLRGNGLSDCEQGKQRRTKIYLHEEGNATDMKSLSNNVMSCLGFMIVSREGMEGGEHT